MEKSINDEYIQRLHDNIQSYLVAFINKNSDKVKEVELRLSNRLKGGEFAYRYDCDALCIGAVGGNHSISKRISVELPGSFASDKIIRKNPSIIQSPLSASGARVGKYKNTCWFPILLNESHRAGQLIIWPVDKTDWTVGNCSKMALSTVRNVSRTLRNHLSEMSTSLSEKITDEILENYQLSWRSIAEIACKCIKKIVCDVDDVQYFSTNKDYGTLTLQAGTKNNSYTSINGVYNNYQEDGYHDHGFVTAAYQYRQNIRCRKGNIERFKDYFTSQKNFNPDSNSLKIQANIDNAAIMALPAFFDAENIEGVFLVSRKIFSKSKLEGFWPCEEFIIVNTLPLVAKMIHVRKLQSNWYRAIDTIGYMFGESQENMDKLRATSTIHSKNKNELLNLFDTFLDKAKGNPENKEILDALKTRLKPIL